MAYMVELHNRLEAENVKQASLCVRVSASERSINMHANYMDINLANKNKRKRKRKSRGSKKKGTCKLCKEQFNEPVSVYLGHYQRSSNCPNQTREVIKSVLQVACQKDEKALPKDVMDESGGSLVRDGEGGEDDARFDEDGDEYQLSGCVDGEDGDDSSRFSTSSSSDDNDNEDDEYDEDNEYDEDDDNESDDRKDINNDFYDDYSGQCANETANEDDIESLTDLTDIGNNNEDV